MAMNWQQLLCAERLGRRPAKFDQGRSAFLSDHDKIIFSGAFRRLARKTQVHPLATNDHIHNRMTHSLEVACVGRTLGISVGQALRERGRLPEMILPTDFGDIIQSACLAHDIGNPPFGHTGEEAIRDWFLKEGLEFIDPLPPEQAYDFRCFEGNAQGFRILTTSEYHQYEGGMRLTYATLASCMKYPWTAAPSAAGLRPRKNKYGVFNAELPLFHEVATKVGLLEQGEHWFCRHPLVYLMEAADDFCYGILDLEDGMEMELLRWEEVYELLAPVITAQQRRELDESCSKLRPGRKAALLRGKVLEAYIDAGVQAFVDNEQALLEGRIEGDLISLCEPVVRDSVQQAKTLAKQRIFSHPRKVELEIGAYDVISRLFDAFCPAVDRWIGGYELRKKEERILDLIGRHTFASTTLQQRDRYQALMRVVDFVSGMTDNYATYLAKQFSGMAY